MIRGYPEQPSPRPGEPLVLRVATDAPQFRIEFYRHGAQMNCVARSHWLPGADRPLHLPADDWGLRSEGLHCEDLPPWPAYRLRIPEDWTSGVYVAILVEGDETGRDLSSPNRTTPDGRTDKALFVVRSPCGREADVLYKLPLLTYHAYNLAGGEPYDPALRQGQWCLYNFPRLDQLPRPFEPGVGLHRPGGGTGATPYDVFNTDPFDPSPRQTFIHWDAGFVAWLESSGYRLDYCTDVDLHREGYELLAPYRLLLSAGHDEYWSDDMRSGVERFLVAGGNAAFFGGNTAWWRVVFSDDVTFSRVEFWHETGRPENEFVGVSFRNGGERDSNEHPIPVGYLVQNSLHWIYDHTGLRDGDVFGGAEDEYIVGYECDGAAFDREPWESGQPATPSREDGTPRDFTILAVGDTRPSGWGFGNCAATMGTYGDGIRGSVFNAATTDWVRVLVSGTSPAVERITGNVVDRLSRPLPSD